MSLNTRQRIDKEDLSRNVLDKVRGMNIAFSTQLAEDVFKNHIDSLIDRMIEGSTLNNNQLISEEVLSELTPEALTSARKATEELFAAFAMSITNVELVLVATHIQLCLNERSQ